MEWLLVFALLIGEGLAELTCDGPSATGKYYPLYKDTCRVSDINNAFNNGMDLMRWDGGLVSIFYVWM